MPELEPATNSPLAVCARLTRAISRTRTVSEIYTVALEALFEGLGVSRSSILLFDPDDVMRFKAWRGLSDTYRQAVEGHTPWRRDTPDPEPIVVPDVREEPSLDAYLPIITAEGIAAMAFVPLVSQGQVIGKFMLYYDAPRALGADELQLASLVASQVAFAVERTGTEAHARRSEGRLRFALDAALMGTWDWNLQSGAVRWSDNLERLHRRPPGSFTGTFDGYQQEIHPDDRARVQDAVRRAVEDGEPYDVEYRIVADDGAVQWVEGKGQVEYEDGHPAHMTGVCMVVTRRKEAELQRLAAAEETARLKDDFLATLSHELRTPLNAILGWVQMLQSGSLAPDHHRQAIDVISRNARLQAQLIEDILDVSRIITGKLEIDRQTVAVGALVENAIAAILPALEARRVVVQQDVDGTLPTIHGDSKRLQQVLGNVLSNAAKFTPEGGAIDVSCHADGDAIVIDVRDTGAGIEPAFLPFVFDRFRQADSHATRTHGGLGLGLSIARHLVERHGGTIVAESPGTGQGTTIRIRLPLHREAVASHTSEGPTASEAVDLDLRLDGTTVLVVDDQEDSREVLAALFERCGARVLQGNGTRAALDTLALAQVDLLVADLGMPGIDGYELIREVRRTRGRLPAIALSGHTRPQDRHRAIESGYDCHCAKPVDAAQMLRMIGRLMAAGSPPAAMQ